LNTRAIAINSARAPTSSEAVRKVKRTQVTGITFIKNRGPTGRGKLKHMCRVGQNRIGLECRV
jgi:hypothetical protein